MEKLTILCYHLHSMEDKNRIHDTILTKMEHYIKFINIFLTVLFFLSKKKKKNVHYTMLGIQNIHTHTHTVNSTVLGQFQSNYCGAVCLNIPQSNYFHFTSIPTHASVQYGFSREHVCIQYAS